MTNRLASFLANDGTSSHFERLQPVPAGDILVDLAGNPIGTTFSSNIVDALNNAVGPSAANVFATIADISGLIFKGSWDASGGAYPVGPNNGEFWMVTVAGITGDGKVWQVGDIALYNTASGWIQSKAPTIRFVPVVDIDSPAELHSIVGTFESFIAVAFEIADPNLWTLYCWDITTTQSEDMPYLVRSGSGGWSAGAGQYIRGGSIKTSGGITSTGNVTGPNLAYKAVPAATDNVATLSAAGQIQDGGVKMSAKQNMVVPSAADNVATLSAGGALQDSGVKLSTKQNLISSPTNNHLASTDAAGQTKDSGLSIVTSIADPGLDTNIATEKAVRTTVNATPKDGRIYTATVSTWAEFTAAITAYNADSNYKDAVINVTGSFSVPAGTVPTFKKCLVNGHGRPTITLENAAGFLAISGAVVEFKNFIFTSTATVANHFQIPAYGYAHFRLMDCSFLVNRLWFIKNYATSPTGNGLFELRDCDFNNVDATASTISSTGSSITVDLQNVRHTGRLINIAGAGLSAKVFISNSQILKGSTGVWGSNYAQHNAYYSADSEVDTTQFTGTYWTFNVLSSSVGRIYTADVSTFTQFANAIAAYNADANYVNAIVNITASFSVTTGVDHVFKAIRFNGVGLPTITFGNGCNIFLRNALCSWNDIKFTHTGSSYGIFWIEDTYFGHFIFNDCEFLLPYSWFFKLQAGGGIFELNNVIFSGDNNGTYGTFYPSSGSPGIRISLFNVQHTGKLVTAVGNGQDTKVYIANSKILKGAGGTWSSNYPTGNVYFGSDSEVDTTQISGTGWTFNRIGQEGLWTATAAGAAAVDADVALWPTPSAGLVIGTGGRLWFARKTAGDVYFVELTTI